MRPTPALFPQAPRSQVPKAVLVVGYVAAPVALTTTALLRQAGVPATQTVWAEDGRIFYSQALRLPLWQTLVRQHDGYGQLYPRLAAQLARLVPAGRASQAIALLGALSLAGLACLVFHMARAHVAPVLVRCLLPLAMVLLPVAGTELLDNLVNVPWWLFFASFWAMLWRPKAAPGKVAAGLVCALAAASEPLVALLLPLGAARFVALRSATDQSPSAGLLAGLAYQAGVILTAGMGRTITPRGVPGIATSFALRTGLGLLGGTKGTNALAAHYRALALVLGGLVLVVVLATGVWVVPRARSFTLWASGLAVRVFRCTGLAPRRGPGDGVGGCPGREPLPGGAPPPSDQRHHCCHRPFGAPWPRRRPPRAEAPTARPVWQVAAPRYGGRGAGRHARPQLGCRFPGHQPAFGRAELAGTGEAGSATLHRFTRQRGAGGHRPSRLGRRPPLRGPGRG